MADEFLIGIADYRASRHYPAEAVKETKYLKAGKKLDPYTDSLQRIKTAYHIIGYNYVKGQPKGTFPWNVEPDLKSGLEDTYRYDHIDTMKLNDPEAAIVRKLCEAPRYTQDREGRITRQPPIPLDPQKRIYRISEAINPNPVKSP